MTKTKDLNAKIDFIIESIEMISSAEDIVKVARESLREIINKEDLNDKIKVDNFPDKDIWMGIISNLCLRWIDKKEISVTEFGRHMDMLLRAEFLRKLMKGM